MEYAQKLILIAVLTSAGCGSIGYNSSKGKSVATHTWDDGLNPTKTERVAIEGDGSAFSTGFGINFNAIPGGNDSLGYGAGGYGYGGYSNGYGNGYGGMTPMGGYSYSVPIMVTTPIIDYPATPVMVAAPTGSAVGKSDPNTSARLAAVEQRQAETETDVHKLAAVQKIVAKADKPHCAEFLKNPDAAGLDEKQKTDAVAACKQVLGIKEGESR